VQGLRSGEGFNTLPECCSVTKIPFGFNATLKHATSPNAVGCIGSAKRSISLWPPFHSFIMPSSLNASRRLNNEGIALPQSLQFEQATARLTHALYAVKQVTSSNIAHASASFGTNVDWHTHQ